MKLIIDVPEQMYLNAKEDLLSGSDTLVSGIKNGIPLDKIRAEIDSHCSENRDRNDGLYIAMKIIDKYTK